MSDDASLLELLQRCNDARTARGLRALRRESLLDGAAAGHARYLAAGGFLSHGGENGSTPGDRARDAGYRWQRVGENLLARTTADAAAAFEQWWHSEGHRDNLLTADFSACGLGRAYSPLVDCWYYVLLMAQPAQGGAIA